jgi:ABC-type transport system substrate-binding protein
MFPGLESVTTPDASTVVVKFKNSFAPFLTYAASSDNVIMPREIFDSEGHFKDTAVGSGPFQLDQSASQRGSKWVMKKNPTYYEDGRPYLDEYHLVVVRDEATRQAALASKQIDYYVGTTDAKTWDEIRRLAPGTNEFIFTSTPRSLYLQLKDSIFSDPKLREAVACALNRDELIQVGGGGRGEWALMFANTRSDLFTQEEIKAILCQDLEKAKRLVKESGYTAGVEIPMLYNPEAAESTTAPTELIQAQLKKAGINIQFDIVSRADFTKRRRARQIDIMFLGEAQRADVDASLHLAIHPAGSFNYTNIDDPKINKLLVDQRQEVDPVKRRELLREILRYANGNNIIHGMYRANQNIFTHTYVHDFYHHADLRSQGSLTNAWIDK